MDERGTNDQTEKNSYPAGVGGDLAALVRLLHLPGFVQALLVDEPRRSGPGTVVVNYQRRLAFASPVADPVE